jgi:hypothetical protein
VATYLAVPYVEDAHALHLYHFDGDALDSAAANPIDLTLDSGATATDVQIPGLGQALNTYEGTAATSGNLPSAMASTDTAISNFVGPDGAFTFEALVCPAFGLGAIPNHMQIICGDHDSARGWHFRVESGGNLVFTKLTGTIQDNMRIALPSSGPHAFAANKWFHVAVTYNGQEDTDGNLKLYWTAMDSGASEAVLLGSFRMTADLSPTVAPRLVIGNEGRSFNGRTENWEGWIDEVRISDIARGPADMAPFVDTGTAYSPIPANGATDVPRDVVLSWTPGESVVTADVYLGTSADDVANATVADPLGVLVGPGLSADTHDAGRLEFGQTYYWRVDGVDASLQVSKGRVWSFTVEPYSYPITGITATASSSNSADMGPEKTIDGSGLNANDQHSTVAEDGWLSAKGAAQPTWIQYEFDKLYKLDRMQVWNSNQGLEFIFGFGARDVAVEYSADGVSWTALGQYEFAKAPGAATYVGDIFVDFAGAAARYVKLTITSNWSTAFQQYGLSEVRFFAIPVVAREPDPISGATDVPPQATLSWRAGREAASHEVHLGTDEQAVTDGTAGAITVAQSVYETALDLAATYYWKVVEVNEAETPNAWASDVWSFSTPQYLIVDDFEDYTNNSPKRVFQTWIDGAGFSADEFFPNDNLGNATGALVGYDPTLGDIMETVLVYGGNQSMPLYYSGSVSEATRTFDPPQDWTGHGITTLVLFIRGDVNNVSAPVYVKVNGTKVPGTISTTKALWQQWNIPLASVSGVTFSNVKTLTIGVGNGSGNETGTIFVDEIRLYATPPQTAIPVNPGMNGLAALYAFENNVQDSSGKGLHGTANGEPGYVSGPAGMGMALAFDGVNDYVDLPIGTLVSTLNSSTFAAWVNYPNVGNAWQRVFDISASTTVNMFLTPDQGGDNLRFAITTSGNTGEQQLTSPGDFPTGWHHAAVVIDSATMTLTLYIDGTPVDSGPTTLLPKNLGVTTSNWLGRSIYTADPYFNGAIDGFRIYGRALSEGEIRYLAGDR